MKQMIMKTSDTTLIWVYKGREFKVQILPQACPKCKRQGTLTGLPEPLLAEQPDKTNVVCNIFIDGCNHGFNLDVDPATLSTEVKAKRGKRG